MATWSKLKIERVLVGRDWTLDLDGATIVGTPEAFVLGDDSLTIEFLQTTDNLTKFWIANGTPGRKNVRVVMLIETSESETLAAVVNVIVNAT